ncbi:hypothetical protein F5Y05DRAFT_391543 [Hypoxylon sp. FL0543]|nr:hypothetical protein F5Y05DRAFT_391543 [Hypoxylon sp. FL0543]
MTIVEIVKVPNLPAFRAGLARDDEIDEKVRFITAHMNWDSVPGFTHAVTQGATGWSPLFDDCTIVLLHGYMQLDDDERTFAGTNTAVRVRGSKTLKILGESAAVWYPAPCCWEVEGCYRSTLGQCNRLGIGNVREVRVKRSWWRRFTGAGKTRRATRDEIIDACFEFSRRNMF